MPHDPKRELIVRAIVRDGDRLLANRALNRKTGEAYYALPGGHVDPGESCALALAREFHEELGSGLRVGDLCLVTESLYPGRKAKDTQRHELVLYFDATLTAPLQEQDGRIVSPEDDKHFEWVAVADLPATNLLPRALKAYLIQSYPADGHGGMRPPYYAFEDSTRT